MNILINIKGLSSSEKSVFDPVFELLRLKQDERGIPVTLSQTGKGLSVSGNESGINIAYERKCELLRAFSFIKKVLRDGREYEETPRYTTLCYLADVSRNAVMKVEEVKRLLNHLAVLGYDSVMLYTEDTYELPEYPYFGYMRGRYTRDELKEIDRYAADIGIEMIPCIQTLAHLNAALRWPGFYQICDVNDILLAGDDRTYALIEAMFQTMSECFSSRRINIGMDEAHMVGLGKYLDEHGYVKNHEIILKHLERVIDISKKYDYKPMMWSDMFFRMVSGGVYYSSEVKIPSEISKRIPPEVQLIYWDYYNYDQKVLDHMTQTHASISCSTAFAGGAYKWFGFEPENSFSMMAGRLQIDACLQNGITDIIATGWGDRGGEASNYSILPTLMLYAEKCYADDAGDVCISERLDDCFGLTLEDFYALELVHTVPGYDKKRPYGVCKAFLYNDPLNGLFNNHIDASSFTKHYKTATEKLRAVAKNTSLDYVFRTIQALSCLLEIKCALPVNIRCAYKKGDKAELIRIAYTDIPETIKRLEAFVAAFREQWNTENKPFGFDVQEMRFGGMLLRLSSVKERIIAYCEGKTNIIDELEEESLDFNHIDPNNKLSVIYPTWGEASTACVL